MKKITKRNIGFGLMILVFCFPVYMLSYNIYQAVIHNPKVIWVLVGICLGIGLYILGLHLYFENKD